MWPLTASNWLSVARIKQDQRDKAITEGLLAAGPATPNDEVYLSSAALDIANKIKTQEWKAGDVVRAYIRRTAIVHARLNCLTEVRFKLAIEEADALDAKFAQSQTVRGSLHGVPMSVKENFYLNGFDTSCGYSAWTNRPAATDGGVVRLLRSEGAIIIAKTNVPQTLMFFECSNPIFGRTSNPWQVQHTCGGSSGGEAAMLATDGSALGIGTDIGGSLRIPATYCGVYALKPSTGRVSNQGRAATNPGQESIPIAAGPMGRSVDDVDMLARVLLGQRTTPWDPLAPVPYKAVELAPAQQLRFGFYTFDGCYRSSPANERAVLETVAALRVAGHEVIEFEPPNLTQAIKAFVGMSSADGYETLLTPIIKDPKEKELFLITLSPKIPDFIRPLLIWLVRTFIGDAQYQTVIENSRRKSVNELWKYHVARDEYIQGWYTEIWEKYGFDGIIAPPQAIPAPAHGATSAVPTIAVSTFVYNLTDMPVGVVPVTRVDATKDALTPEWRAAGPRGGVMVERRLYDGKEPIYNAERMHGLPVGIQIVGRRWDDEKVLAMMRVVDQALGKRSFGPGSWAP